MAKGIPTRLTPAEGRRFGLVVGPAFLALSTLLWWRGHAHAAALTVAIGTLLVLAALVIPSRLGPVHATWMRLAAMISKVTTPVFMGVVYYGVLTPTGLLIRLFGRDPLTRHRRDSSLWVSRSDESFQHSDMRRQF